MAFISPDCDKPLPHGGCTGGAFDPVADEVVACECSCHPVLTPRAAEDSDAVAGKRLRIGGAVRLYSPGIVLQAHLGIAPFVYLALSRDYENNTATYHVHAGGGLPLEPIDGDPTAPYEVDAVIAFLEATLEVLRTPTTSTETKSLEEIQAEIAARTEVDLDTPNPNDVLPDALFEPDTPAAEPQPDVFKKGF